MPIPVASRSSDLATAEPSEWPTRIGDLHRCDEREYVPQNALVTDPNAVSLNAGWTAVIWARVLGEAAP